MADADPEVVTQTEVNTVTQTGAPKAAPSNDAPSTADKTSSDSQDTSRSPPADNSDTGTDSSSKDTSTSDTASPTRTRTTDAVDETSSTSSDTETPDSSATTTPISTSTVPTTTDDSSSSSKTTSSSSDSDSDEDSSSSTSKHTSLSDVTSTKTKSAASDTTTLPDAPTKPASKEDKSGLGTGQIIGISLAGFVAAGILVLCLGTLLRWRRRKALERRTAHLQRASQIWDFADSNNASAIEAANEKAANEVFGRDAPKQAGAPSFASRGQHSRQDSSDSHNSTGQESSASYNTHAPSNADGFPPASRLATGPHAPPSMMPYAPPSMMPYAQPANTMQRMANRLSGYGLFPAGSRAPPPGPMLSQQQSMPGMYGTTPPMPHPPVQGFPPNNLAPSLDRQDSFGNRAYQPPRNNFFPQPVSQQSSDNVHPLALPGSRY